MKISKLIKRLEKVKKINGDIEVTCTGSSIPDKPEDKLHSVFETTVETLLVFNPTPHFPKKRIRLYM